jgi:4-methylaminobutanoate oxidase (formaldehyde-forming)
LGYVREPNGTPVEAIGADEYEVEVAGVRYAATASLRPMYDPKSERIKC